MINNDEQLIETLGLAIKQAMNNTTEILLDKLKDTIKEKVYSYDATFYGDNRSFEFLNSWESEGARIIGKYVENTIFQNHSIMSYDSDSFRHGNNHKPLKDGALTEIIDQGLMGANPYNFPVLNDRQFWDSWLTWVDSNLPLIFKLECKKLGLDLN